jgi:hypothetical protein
LRMMPLHWLPSVSGSSWWAQVSSPVAIWDKKASPSASKCSNNSEQLAFLCHLCSVVRLRGTHLAHTFEYPEASIIVIALPLLTESCMANCQLVMRQSVWIMSSARCNMSGLVAVARCPDRGRPCSSISPLPEALTLWTQRPTVLLLTAKLPYTAHNRLWMFPTLSFSATKNSITACVVCNVCHTQTPFSQTTPAALSVRRPCNYTHMRNKHQCCYLSVFTLLCLFWNEKKNVGHYFLSNLHTICGHILVISLSLSHRLWSSHAPFAVFPSPCVFSCHMCNQFPHTVL